MTPITLASLTPLMPELFLAITAMILLIYGVFRGNKSTHVVAMGTVFSFIGALFLLSMVDVSTRVHFTGMFEHDGFTRFGKMLVLLGGILSMILAERWIKSEENNRFEFPILVQFAVIGMLLMISASDMLAVYVGMELMSLSLYVLAAFRRDDVRSSEAGLKYFILGSLASGMMLFGISLVYGFSGTIGFRELSEMASLMMTSVPEDGAAQLSLVSHGLIIGLVLVIVGFCFKVSAVPFHMWTPDVYEGAPTPVTAFFAMAPKIAALFILVRVLNQPFQPLEQYWQQIIVMVSCASMIIGALGALTQSNIKRLLAYSSIGHVGYVLVGVAAGNEQGIMGVAVYLALYLFMTAGAFGCVLMMQRNDKAVEQISSLAGLSRQQPRLALALGVILFSMAGIPPLAGFFGKMYVFLAAIEAQLYGLAILGVLSSVIAAFYYLKIIKIMYFDEGDASFDKSETSGLPFTVAICTIIILGFVLAPSVLTVPATAAAKALLL